MIHSELNFRCFEAKLEILGKNPLCIGEIDLSPLFSFCDTWIKLRGGKVFSESTNLIFKQFYLVVALSADRGRYLIRLQLELPVIRLELPLTLNIETTEPKFLLYCYSTQLLMAKKVEKTPTFYCP